VPEAKGRSGHDPSEQLARLQSLCRKRSVEVYRDQALYLQILRDELRDSTRQALFRLISDVDPGRFSALPESSRHRFHAAVDGLIQRCSVLLTVEQLMHLMMQMEEEVRRRQARLSRDMLRGLAEQQQQSTVTPAPAAEELPQEPSGSVHLSFNLPVNDPQAYSALPPPSAQTPSVQPPSAQTPSAQTPFDQQLSQPESSEAGSEVDVLRSLFQLAGDALEHSTTSLEEEIAEFSGGNHQVGDHGLLPEMPDALLQWMDGLDQALSRRLRNLSHAVNVQMLRCGLAGTLLPVNLLEAVLRGQVETQSTATNLLRLRLPMAMGEVEQGVDVLCLLLRTSELEFDSHRLRRCRRRLHAHHRDLLTMVRQQRHWQRRCLDLEARSHWQSPTGPNPHPLSGA
jgi:hypothetical protein